MHKVHCVVAIPAALAISTGALAQQQRQPVNPIIPEAPRVQFTFGGGYVSQFETDLENLGDVSVDRFLLGIGGSGQINDDLSIRGGLQYALNSYDFSTPNEITGLAEPWDDVHSVTLGLALNYVINEDWSVFGGPVFKFSRESDADWNDSFTAGGSIGAIYRISDELSLGGGVVISSSLEEDVYISPLVIVNWRINEQLRISNFVVGAVSRPGVELVYTPAKEWELALGGYYERERFRLDDDGPAPNGVGEETVFMITGRIGWRPDPNITVDLVAGVTIGGQLELENANGDLISSADYDSAMFIGLFAGFTF